MPITIGILLASGQIEAHVSKNTYLAGALSMALELTSYEHSS